MAEMDSYDKKRPARQGKKHVYWPGQMHMAGVKKYVLGIKRVCLRFERQ